MKKIYNLLLLLFTTAVLPAQITSGDLMIIGLNTDGDDDIALLALNDIPASTIYVSESAWDGSAFSSDGVLTWTITSTISKGTIIDFSDLNKASLTVSHGSIVESSTFALNNSNEAVLVYTGSDINTPTTFICGAGSDDTTSVSVSLKNTELIGDTTFLQLDKVNTDGDIFKYNGATTAATKQEYLARIATMSDWVAEDASGDQSSDGGVVDVPFGFSTFVITNALAGLSSLPSFGIYPNPTQGTLRFTNVESNSTIELMNTSGDIVFETSYDGFPIQFQSLEQGMYFVLVSTNGNYSRAPQKLWLTNP